VSRLVNRSAGKVLKDLMADVFVSIAKTLVDVSPDAIEQIQSALS
jgi:hypothetical protein